MGDPRRPHVQHQNRFAFKHNKASRKTAQILATPNVGLCPKCHDIIEWRKRFRKYKPLSAPRRCQICDQKKVTRAYHNLCDTCACETNTCAKCRESKSIVNPIITPEQERADIQLVSEALSRMTERERRTFLRQITPKTTKDDLQEDEESYWAEEEEIDFVKAAKVLRAREQLKAEKAEKAMGKGQVGDADDEEEEEDDEGEEEDEEDEDEDTKKQQATTKPKDTTKDNKQTNSDPKSTEADEDEEEEDYGEGEEDDEN